MGVAALWQTLVAEGVVHHLDGSEASRSALVGRIADSTVAVDLSAWILAAEQAEALQQAGHFSAAGRVLKVVFERCLNMLRYGLVPVFVLEGLTPTAKLATLSARGQDEYGSNYAAQGNGLSRQSGLDQRGQLVARLLQQLGLPSVQAPGEAEAMCAALNAAGLVNAVATPDVDALLFGAQLVYRELHLQVDGAQNNSLKWVDMNSLRAALSLRSGGHLALVAVAQLAGGDYDQAGAKGVGSVSALKVVKHLLAGDEDDSNILSRLAAALEAGPDPEVLALTKCTGCKRCGHQSATSSSCKHHSKQGCMDCGTAGTPGGGCHEAAPGTQCACAFHRRTSERLVARMLQRVCAVPGFAQRLQTAGAVYAQQTKLAQQAVQRMMQESPEGVVFRWLRRPDSTGVHHMLGPELGWSERVVRDKMLPLLVQWDVAAGPSCSTSEFVPVAIAKERRAGAHSATDASVAATAASAQPTVMAPSVKGSRKVKGGACLSSGQAMLPFSSQASQIPQAPGELPLSQHTTHSQSQDPHACAAGPHSSTQHAAAGCNWAVAGTGSASQPAAIAAADSDNGEPTASQVAADSQTEAAPAVGGGGAMAAAGKTPATAPVVAWRYLLQLERAMSVNPYHADGDASWLAKCPASQRCVRMALLQRQWPALVEAFQQRAPAKKKAAPRKAKKAPPESAAEIAAMAAFMQKTFKTAKDKTGISMLHKVVNDKPTQPAAQLEPACDSSDNCDEVLRSQSVAHIAQSHVAFGLSGNPSQPSHATAPQSSQQHVPSSSQPQKATQPGQTASQRSGAVQPSWKSSQKSGISKAHSKHSAGSGGVAGPMDDYLRTKAASASAIAGAPRSQSQCKLPADAKDLQVPMPLAQLQLSSNAAILPQPLPPVHSSAIPAHAFFASAKPPRDAARLSSAAQAADLPADGDGQDIIDLCDSSADEARELPGATHRRENRTRGVVRTMCASPSAVALPPALAAEVSRAASLSSPLKHARDEQPSPARPAQAAFQPHSGSLTTADVAKEQAPAASPTKKLKQALQPRAEHGPGQRPHSGQQLLPERVQVAACTPAVQSSRADSGEPAAGTVDRALAAVDSTLEWLQQDALLESVNTDSGRLDLAAEQQQGLPQHRQGSTNGAQGDDDLCTPRKSCSGHQSRAIEVVAAEATRAVDEGIDVLDLRSTEPKNKECVGQAAGEGRGSIRFPLSPPILVFDTP